MIRRGRGMALEVDFITLGDASDRIGVPSPTLRHWTDQLESLEVHFVKRNNRNERIYYDTDLEIFEFLRDLKQEHGRRTTTKDLAYMIREMSDRFELRTREDAPQPSQPSNKTADLLNQEDIQRLMQSERVKQFISIVIDEATKNLKDDLKHEVRQEVNKEMLEVGRQMVENHNRLEQQLKERDEKIEKQLEARMKQTDEYIQEFRARQKLPWWKKMFS
ncbi:MerR family transcriptional regulator [Bacillus cereus]|uniref:MerR family transcriptional regulator n=1 Tax=Bacillus cereus TaxID=1396 RepID=UPI001D158D3B|nr:MerR family transcriptional regulator [Bacillus cereus]MCC3687392.1 MerR family transcriptional regulator [Bacillus cereus]